MINNKYKNFLYRGGENLQKGFLKKFYGFIAISIILSIFYLWLNKGGELYRGSNPLETRLLNDSKNMGKDILRYPNPYKALIGQNIMGNFKKSFMKSGIITQVPWEGDIEFRKSQSESNTPILMLAFRTILPNPAIGEEFNVHLAANILKGTIVQSGEIFSQNKTVGPYTESRGFKKGLSYAGSNLTITEGGGVCKIASTLYNLAILCNLEVVERFNHSMPVAYLPYGQDATVVYGSKDIKFKNTTEFPILIWAQGIGNELYMAFYGSEKPPRVEWHHKIIERYPAPIIYKHNSKLDGGSKNILVEGMDGALVQSWVTIDQGDGEVEIKELGRAYYYPMVHLIGKGD